MIQLPSLGIIPKDWQHKLEDWLHPVIGFGEAEIEGTWAYDNKVLLIAIAVACAVVGIVAAWIVYEKKRATPFEPQLLADGWDYDRAISWFMGNPGRAGFEAVADFDAQRRRRCGQRRRHGRDGVPPVRPARARPATCATTRAGSASVSCSLARVVRRDSRDAVIARSSRHHRVVPDPDGADPPPLFGALLVAILVAAVAPSTPSSSHCVTSVATAAMSIWLLASFETGEAGFQFVVEAHLDRAVGHLAGISASTASRCSSSC